MRQIQGIAAELPLSTARTPAIRASSCGRQQARFARYSSDIGRRSAAPSAIVDRSGETARASVVGSAISFPKNNTAILYIFSFRGRHS
jgi:hypothetical protein